MPLLIFPNSGVFDSVGSTELQDAGKAGLVTVQGKISAVLGTVLVCKSSCPLLENSNFNSPYICELILA